MTERDRSFALKKPGTQARPVVSIDLAYRSYEDIGAVVLEAHDEHIDVTIRALSGKGSPTPSALASHLDDLCAQHGARLLLLDGPQGWKLPDNGHQHCRCCERELNTPAKTGEPGHVKPGNYLAFVGFSIAVFDELATRGWRRIEEQSGALGDGDRLMIESFPLAAWRTLRLQPLPSKAKTTPPILSDRLRSLEVLLPLSLSGLPTHDDLQALVAGVAGVALELGRAPACQFSGVPPVFWEGYWREGFILCPRPFPLEVA
jgi:hypothetical protein